MITYSDHYVIVLCNIFLPTFSQSTHDQKPVFLSSPIDSQWRVYALRTMWHVQCFTTRLVDSSWLWCTYRYVFLKSYDTERLLRRFWSYFFLSSVYCFQYYIIDSNTVKLCNEYIIITLYMCNIKQTQIIAP